MFCAVMQARSILVQPTWRRLGGSWPMMSSFSRRSITSRFSRPCSSPVQEWLGEPVNRLHGQEAKVQARCSTSSASIGRSSAKTAPPARVRPLFHQRYPLLLP